MEVKLTEVNKEEPNGKRYGTRGIRKTYVNDVDIGFESDQSEHDKPDDNLKPSNPIVDEDWDPVEVMLSSDDNDICSSDDDQMESDSFDGESDFEEHFSSKKNQNVSYDKVDDQFICSECCQFFQTEEDAEKHVNEHRNGFICEICKKKCKSVYSLSCHKLNHHTSVHRCCQCPFQGKNVSEMIKHSRKNHKSAKGSRMCHMCGLILQSEDLWLLHCHEVHKIGEKPEPKYICQICDRKMFSRGTYNAHTRTHLEKVYKCHYKNCNYKTASKSALKGHAKSVHLGIRRYKCTFEGCDKSFNVKVSRKEHMNMVHYKIRNIPCTWPECEKRFYADKHLKMHLKIHTGEKDLSCEHCDYRCIQKAALNWHLDKKHGIVNEKKPVITVKANKPGRKSKEGKKIKGRKNKIKKEDDNSCS